MDDATHLAATLRAGLYRIVRDRLLAFESHATDLTFILV